MKNAKCDLRKKQSLRGFTLIEALVSIFIFALIMMLISGTFANFFKSYANAKKMEVDLENVQYASDLMAKTIRTSDVSSGGTSTLNTYDFSQNKCIRYELTGNKIQSVVTTQTTATKESDCVWGSGSDVTSDLTTNTVTSFGVAATGATGDLITFDFGIQEPGQTGQPLQVQTSVAIPDSSLIAPSFSCQGSVAANSIACAGTGAALTVNRNYSLVSSCSASQTDKCESECETGYNYSGGVCVAVSADTIPPTIPAALAATPVSAVQIKLSWTASTDNVGVTGYEVWRYNGTTFVKINSSAVSGTTYLDLGLTPNTMYSYYVKAFDAAGNVSGNSNTVNATTLADPCLGVTAPITNGISYAVVPGDDGKCWLASNLGTSNIAGSFTDNAAYGWHFQWGRAADNHQLSTSLTTSTLSGTDNPGNGNFILTLQDWRSPSNDNLWQGVGGINNPCPIGFHVPTRGEWNTLISKAGIVNGTTAANSSLKLSATGTRGNADGNMYNLGVAGYYWCSDPYVGSTSAYYLNLGNSNADTNNYGSRATGISVRCVK